MGGWSNSCSNAARILYLFACGWRLFVPDLSPSNVPFFFFFRDRQLPPGHCRRSMPLLASFTAPWTSIFLPEVSNARFLFGPPPSQRQRQPHFLNRLFYSLFRYQDASDDGAGRDDGPLRGDVCRHRQRGRQVWLGAAKRDHQRPRVLR